MIAALLALLVAAAPPASVGKGLRAVPFDHVTITDPFFQPRIDANRDVTIDACLDQCEKTHRLENFAVAAGIHEGKHEGYLFNDSDVYKTLEGAAYALQTGKNEKLEARVDGIIDWIAAAQREDGYLDTYFQLVEPQNKWKNIRHGHELYCAGHLIEAAVAYAKATKKTKLLDVALKLAHCIDKEFGPGKHVEPTGHPELELALVKLADFTGDRHWLDLSKWFIDIRGTRKPPESFGEYAQDVLPLRESSEVTGHAVRAMYLYSGACDVAARTNDQPLLDAMQRIWKDVVPGKMYITGGIGSAASNEGFTKAWDLPNDTAYCETCAGIGLSLWAHRMFLLTGDASFADVMERAIYNNVLAGVSVKGDRFFYDNPLASTGDHHRVEWFGCACCPPNVARFVPSIAERIYAVGDDGVYVLMNIDSTAQIPFGGRTLTITQRRIGEGDDRRAFFGVSADGPARTRLHLRRGNHFLPPIDVEVGEASFGLTSSDRTSTQRVTADARVTANGGRVALQRGPIVYCLEGRDQPGGRARNLVLPDDAKITEEATTINGIATTVLHADGLAVTEKDGVMTTEPAKLTAIPYCLWDNREPGEMVVWIPTKPELAELPGDAGSVVVNGTRVRAPHCYRDGSPSALIDGILPKDSDDHSVARCAFWPHKGGTESAEYRFDAPRTLSSSAVYWFDDTGHGECRLPKTWRLLWKKNGTWVPVTLAPDTQFGVEKDRLNEIRFQPVTTTGLRLEIDQQDGFATGILEWSIAPEK